MDFDLSEKRIFVSGHLGMVGSAILRRLNTVECEIVVASRSEVDLREQNQVRQFFSDQKIDVVFHPAARVGGIHANRANPAEFLYDNLMISANVIDAAHHSNVEKLLYLGSSCVYPKLAPQPMTEDVLLTSSLEETNQWYALAKISGLKLCESYRLQYGRDFICAMPTNLYGYNDNFDLQNSHVLPAMIRKFHEAKIAGDETVTIWGTGSPRREFLHVDDLADALVFMIEHYSSSEIVNVGCGEDITIGELAQLVRSIVGFDGRIVHDSSMPDGTPRKLLDVSRLSNMGWKPKISLADGTQSTYHWYCEMLKADRTKLRM